MRARTLLITGYAFTTIFVAGAAAQEGAGARPPIAVSSATVTIEGTSKKHPFLASTKTVRVTRVRVAGPPYEEDVLQQIMRPGGLVAFDVTIPVMTLSSTDEGVEGHLHNSLKAETHPDIRFQLRSIVSAPGGTTGSVPLMANGTLTVAGVDREVTLRVKVIRAGNWLFIDGNTDLLMTDFGVKPPQGFLGMLATDPWIRVRFYLAVTTPDA